MKSLELTPVEAKVFSVLLQRAVEQLGNNSCNDFSLVRDAGLNDEEVNVIDNELRKTFPRDMSERTDPMYYISDFFLLALLEEKVKGLL